MNDQAYADTLRLLIGRMRDITHLNNVLRKKNRRLVRLKNELDERKRRIVGLLTIFDAVKHVSTRAEARGLADIALEYDERREWFLHERRQHAMTAEHDDEPNEVRDEPKDERAEDIGDVNTDAEHAAPVGEGDGKARGD